MKLGSIDTHRFFPRATSIAATAILVLLASAAPAHAVCTPAAGDNVTATCTGTTNNQNTPYGYGQRSAINLNTTVVQGATVTGTNNGITFTTGSVTNAGAVTGTAFSGVFAVTSPTVTNSGTITGGNYGVNTLGSTTVTNSGSITGGNGGIVAFGGSATVTNSGTISGPNSGGINANTDVTVTNSGVVTGGIFGTTATVTNSGNVADGIVAFGSATVTNTVTGTVSGGITADNATVTNSGLITGDAAAITTSSATVTNSGTITATGGGSSAVYASTTANVVNSGLMTGDFAGVNFDNGTVTNSGTIAATGAGGIAVFANTTANVTNSGLVTGGAAGILANTSATVINSGTITATDVNGIGLRAGTTGNVTNSGAIIGASGTAIQFNGNGTPGSDTLTVLTGARFGGLVNFGGGADKVNFGPGNWVLNTANFDKALSTVTTPGTPYFVTPNRIVVADVSGFGAQNRAIMDITGWIGSVLPDAPVFAPAAGAGANSFAAADTAASPFEAFASIPPDGLGYAATKAPVFKGGAAIYADGNAMWAKGFGGQRQQDTSGIFAGSTTTGYGGAIGYERVLNPDLKIGGLVGASTNKTNLYQNAGSTNTDTVFGGAYGRFTRGSTFLDLAVIGGNLDNRTARPVAGGLALQTAIASYGGWFVDPAMTFGHRIEIDERGFTITPAVKARYVAAHFDGYTETGSTADLTIGGRDFQAWEERAEITFANTRMIGANRVTARVTGGILGQQRSTGGQVNIALIGQSFLAATPDRGRVAGGYGSAGLDWQIGRVTLFAAGEATYANDATRTNAGKGGVRVAW